MEHAPERVVDLRLLPGDVASGIVNVQGIQAAEPGEVSDSSCDSDTDAGSSSDEEVLQNGPWILNSTTGWYHKATHVDEGSDMGLLAPHGRVALSCRPAQALGAQYLVRTSDPFLEGYSRCHHSGCFGCEPRAQLSVEVPTLGDILCASYFCLVLLV